VRVAAAGHSGFAAAGTDIVCAAVSAVIQAAANGAVRFAGAEIETGEGNLAIQVANPIKESNAVLETMRMGLEDLQKSYPRHIKITIDFAK
ncbi:MAG: ribosomal-processing cysteine protease Prp, partial [Firmicutes bacterium]|nr:ribosomal-processing cysteine protease Prp [Bacillota bacterium]